MLWLVLRARWFWNHNPELQFGWVVLVLWAYLLSVAWSSARRRSFNGPGEVLC